MALTPQFHEPEREVPWKAIATLCVGGIALAGAFYVSMNSGGQTEPKELKLIAPAKEPPAAPRGPDAYFIPLTSPAGGAQRPEMPPAPVLPRNQQTLPERPGTPQMAPADQLSELQERAAWQQRQRQQFVQAAPVPAENATTRMQAGAAEFEKVMVVLSQKADLADIAWERFYAGCRQNVVSVTSTAIAGTRAWFSDGTVVTSGAAASTTASVSTWTEACAELGVVRSLTKQIQAGMCLAEDEARRAGVYPGTMRALRTKYRLEWEWCR